jgi:hypothetical protein
VSKEIGRLIVHDDQRRSDMRRLETRTLPSALLAFGRRVTPGDAFEALVAARGWQTESWRPTFVDACDRDQFLNALRNESSISGFAWESKQVLRPPGEPLEHPAGQEDMKVGSRLMIASATDLPTLYFVEWHYIDFVLSCLGNVSEAARVLGVRRSTLQRKRKKSPPSK